jgi:hypothetical protein
LSSPGFEACKGRTHSKVGDFGSAKGRGVRGKELGGREGDMGWWLYIILNAIEARLFDMTYLIVKIPG